ncbi:mannosyltransferase [Tilletia horrida]|nr:mannosyltransferase [Tilletia horrida]
MAHIPADRRFRQAGGMPASFGAGERPAPPRETNHLLQDASTTSSAWVPSFGLVFRALVIVRLVAARYAVIADCDETYNYWEALHLLVFSPVQQLLPFQTWEYAPEFAIRSYAYLLPYFGFAKLAGRVVALNKLDTFYIIRNMLAVLSSLVESRFCIAVAESIHPSVAKYLFVFLLTSAGMSSAATALLPSTFTMYTSTLALAYAFYPARLPSPNSVPAPSNLTLSQTPYLRTLIATTSFALGAILGWPFAIVLSLPFVAEELFLPSGNQVPASLARYSAFIAARLGRFLRGALFAGLVIGGVTTVIDSLAYGRFTVVSLGIVIYNVLSAKRGAGPELYGTEPASYYFANLGLAFNLILPLALFSAPLALLLRLVDPTRLGPPSRTFPLTSVDKTGTGKDKKQALLTSSRLTLLLYRLAPFYLWLGLLTSQAHKEERFMFPAYPLLCFNAATSVYVLRALLEKAVGAGVPAKGARVGPSRLPSIFTATLLLTTSLLSIFRTVHLQSSFYAPTAVLEHFSRRELPQLIGRAFPQTLEGPKQKARLQAGLDAFASEDEERSAQPANLKASWLGRLRATSEPLPLPGLTGLVNMSLLQSEFGIDDVGKPAPIRLCYAKEWYRFPGHFFILHGVRVDFVKSEFAGILPKHYAFSTAAERAKGAPAGLEGRVVRYFDRSLGWAWPWKDVTRTVQDGFNDLNREEMDRYVNIDTCDYLVDLDHPHRYASRDSSDPRRSALEPRHAIDSDKWTRVHCVPFLDASSAAGTPDPRALHKLLATLDRTLFIPAWVRQGASFVLRRAGLGAWESARRYGDFCLLRTTRRESWANRRGTYGLDAE